MRVGLAAALAWQWGVVRPSRAQEAERKRRDNPNAAALYINKLRSGGTVQPLEAKSRAIGQIENLRARTERAGGQRAWIAAAIGNRGRAPVTIGNIPVGSLPLTLPRNQAIPRLNLEERAVPAIGGRAVVATPSSPIDAAIAAAPAPRLGAAFVDLSSLINESDWVWLGPNRVGGRVRSLLFHPSDPNVMWTGGVAGGVFKSIDGGKTWATSYRLMGSLVVSCMVLHPWNPEILFAGTGEGFYNVDAFRGAGIFRSDDGGGTWAQLPATNRDEFRWVNRIAMTRSDQDRTVMLVATRSGLFRSEDDGRTFAAVALPTVPPQDPAFLNEVLDVHFHPKDPTRCVASGRGGHAFYSVDGGRTWQHATGIPTAAGFEGRVELAYAAASPLEQTRPTVVYASVDLDNGQVYRSVDGGRTYTLRNNTLKQFLYHGANPPPGQGWYDNAVWAGDPRNLNVLIVGGIALHISRDGGRTFTAISGEEPAPRTPHTDQHVIASVPGYDGQTVRTVYVGNDGGIYRANDILAATPQAGWEPMNNGLAITQFYGAGIQPDTGQMVAGAQDNDTRLYTPGTGGAPAPESWKVVFGGDGGYSVADVEQPIFYGEYVALQVERYNAQTEKSDEISDTIGDAGKDGRALFIAPVVADPNRPGALAGGGAELWYTKDARTRQPDWKSVKDAVPFRVPGESADRFLLISAITLVKGQPRTAWVGHEYNAINEGRSGALFRSDDFDAQHPSWTEIRDPKLPHRHSTRIVVDPTDPKHVFALYGGYAPDNLWESRDNGGSWATVPITTDLGLLSVPLYDIEFHPEDAKILILATEMGLLVSGNGGRDWSPTSGGPTNCPVFELVLRERNLVAVTHGRGIFQIALGNPVAAAPAAPVGEGEIAP